ncbi:MAG: D-glycero-beta-D-manno-heptose 1,7-bisphosphate 7-phosphatase [Gammaproteobacteria bacterium]|nr:D-glycero-beta-D-manno-heptose 1,7-bisphosphate 7-phosphatase [Gammaproteobacteria bacterium]
MRIVVLDRDGVINYESDAYVKSPDEWIPIPGSLEAIARLSRGGFAVVVATNQAGVGRGLFDLTALSLIHKKMEASVKVAGGLLAGIFFCPHHPDENCDCRKPKPGLMQQIAARFQTDMKGIPAIGDSQRDIRAAQAVAARPILVRTGRGEETLQQLPSSSRIEVFANLAAAADRLLKEIRH